MKKEKDAKYIKLVFTLTNTCKKLKEYLSDDEIARLIALGMQGKEVSNA